MALEAVELSAPLTVGERLAGLNHIAELRARFWRDGWKEVEQFIRDMRNKRDPLFEDNIRALAAIFFLAKIPTVRHELELSELTTDEKKIAYYSDESFLCSGELISKTANHAELTHYRN